MSSFAVGAQYVGEENRGWNVCPFGKDLRIKGENERRRDETTISMPRTIKTDFRIYQVGLSRCPRMSARFSLGQEDGKLPSRPGSCAQQ